MTALLKAPQLLDFPYTIVEVLRFADTDRNGHIISSVFAVCCQSGRLALLSDPVRALEPPRSQFVLASLSSITTESCGGEGPWRFPPVWNGLELVRDVGKSAFSRRLMGRNCPLGRSLHGYRHVAPGRYRRAWRQAQDLLCYQDRRA